MRVVLVSESFLPQVNGVSGTVARVADRLVRTGHEPLVIAPGPGPDHHGRVPVLRTRSVRLPAYRSFPVGLPDRRLDAALDDFRPDLVHLASPFALGAWGLRAARRRGLPTLAVFQTDLAGFASRYAVPGSTRVQRHIDAWVTTLHTRADRTLVPSSASLRQLQVLGVPRLHHWGRGVDLDLFGPHRRDEALHARWAGPDQDPQVVVGYVGRLAQEKSVRRLAEVARVPGTRLVVVGEGPELGWLRGHLPDAVFTGVLHGQELARAFASLDVFVHTGEAETFCQTVQEAQASGVPVVAPAAGGPLDLVAPGRTGLLHDVADPRSLRRTVAALVGDPALRDALSCAGVAAVSHSGWDPVVDELVHRHYAELVRPGVDLERAA